MTRRLIFVLSCACGLAVANLCYSQPLLEHMRGQSRTSAHAVGLIATLTQIVYTLGLLFLVPLGDTLRRRLIVGLLGVEVLFPSTSCISFGDLMRSLWRLVLEGSNKRCAQRTINS